MLGVVKKSHIEISISGEGTKEALDWLRQKFKLVILTDDSKNIDSIDIEQTDFWKAMQENRIGNLLEGARLKSGFFIERACSRGGCSLKYNKRL